MSIEAELADGTVLEFPEGTSNEVVQDAVKKHMLGSAPSLTPNQIAEQQRRAQSSMTRAESPILSRAAEVAKGASQLTRDILPKSVGDYLFPTEGVQDTGYTTAGQILDPTAMAIGAGAGKLAQVGGLLKKPILQSIAGGVLGGGTIGALTEEGSALGGAAIGGTVGAAIPVVGKGVGKLVDWFQKAIPDIRARNILKAFGLDSPEAVTALQNASPGVDVSQAIGSAGKVEIAALQDFANKFKPNEVKARVASQAAARQDAMGAVAGGGTSEASNIAQSKANANINKILEPIRNRTFDLADKSGKLKTDSIVDGINNILDKSDLMKGGMKDKVLREMKGILGLNADDTGVIKADTLHSFRKEEINNLIAKLVPDSGGNAIKTQTAKVASEVRDLVDEAINNASGGKIWSSYLNQYSKLKRSVDKMKIADTLRSGSDKQLVETVSGENPDLVRSVLGRVSKGETEGFVPQMGKQAAPFQKAADEVTRDAILAKNAQVGQTVMEQKLKDSLFSFHPPSLLNAKVNIIKSALNLVGEKVNKSAIDRMAGAMQNPQEVMRIINTLPFAERNAMIQAMQDSTSTGAVSGMLTGVNQ